MIEETYSEKGMSPFGHCPNQGGEAPAQICLPSFHQVVIFQISQFLLNSQNVFGHFLHNHHRWYFIPSCAQFFMSKKEDCCLN